MSLVTNTATSGTTMVTPASSSSPSPATSGSPSISVTLTSAATIAQPAPAIPGTLSIPTANTTINSSSPVSVSSTSSAVLSPKSTIQAKGGNPSTPDRHTASVQSSSAEGTQVLNKQRLQDLVREVDPNEQLDDDVEELLLQIADDFIENVVTTSCLVAKHRKANTLEVKDVQLSLEKNWNMWIPGFGSDELRPYKRSATTEAHKQRMALIRKALKKY